MPTVGEAVQFNMNCLKEADNQRVAGNQFYQSKDYRSAIRCYHNALLKVKAVQQVPQTSAILSALSGGDACSSGDGTPTEDETTDMGGEEGGEEMEDDDDDDTPGAVKRSRTDEMRLEADNIMAKCYNNLAACIINGEDRRVDDYLRAADYCDKVLLKDASNDKAQFRKGVALMKGGLHDKAILAFKKCTDNAEAQRQMQQCHKLINEDRRKRNEEIRQNFERARLRQEAAANRQNQENAMEAVVGDGAVAVEMVAENGTMPNGEVPAASNGHSYD